MANLPENAALRRMLALGPAVAIIGIFMLIPVIIMGSYSFLEAKPYGGVAWVFPATPMCSFSMSGCWTTACASAPAI